MLMLHECWYVINSTGKAQKIKICKFEKHNVFHKDAKLILIANHFFLFPIHFSGFAQELPKTELCSTLSETPEGNLS